jgi:hypothetical protein
MIAAAHGTGGRLAECDALPIMMAYGRGFELVFVEGQAKKRPALSPAHLS